MEPEPVAMLTTTLSQYEIRQLEMGVNSYLYKVADNRADFGYRFYAYGPEGSTPTEARELLVTHLRQALQALLVEKEDT